MSLGADAGAGECAADRGVGRGDVRVGAVVDVEQRALRAFEQDVAAVLAHVVQDGGDVVDHRADVFAPGERFVEHGLVVDRLRPSATG